MPATAILITHNSSAHIESSLRLLTTDDSRPAEIIVLDNGSSDNSADIAESFGVKVIRLEQNIGFPAACNRGAALASNDMLVFLNPDTEPTAGWLPPLALALRDPGVGAAMPVLDLTYARDRWFTSRSALNFLGFAWSTDSGDPIPPQLETTTVPFPSGAAFLIRRSLFEALGGFRAEYFLYLEDVDLGWRLRLAGYRSVMIPGSRVSHDYEFERHADKMYYLERNRLRMVASNYQPSTLALLAPALIAAELGALAAAVKYGWLPDKLRSYRDVWRMRALMREEAAHTRAIRVVGDGEILAGMDSALEGINQVPLSGAFRWINRGLSAYLGLARRLAR